MDSAVAVFTGRSPAGRADPLGERHRLADAAGGEIDAFTLSASLATVPSFEFALRERASRLASFRHAAFVRVRAVERGTGPAALRIVSDGAPGVRLSDVLAGAEARRLPIDINAALCLVRQLVPAVAMLHETVRDVAHGAIGPERLVVTPAARLLITEYVFGAALEQLRFSRGQYWKDLRVPTPPSAGAARFDHRTDVTQIGMVALALILGRPIRHDEFPNRIGDVVASTWAVSPRGGFEPLPPGLRRWLGRALQIDSASGFRSAVDARAELDNVLGDSDYVASPASVEAFLAKFHDERFHDQPGVRLQADVGAPAEAGAYAGAGAYAETRVCAPIETGLELPDALPVGPTPLAAITSAALSLTSPGATVGAAPNPVFAPPPSIEPPVAASFSRAAAPALVDVVPPPPPALPPVTQDAPPAARGFDEDGEHRAAPFLRDWRVMGAAAAALVLLVAGAGFATRGAPGERPVAVASGTLEVATSPAGVGVLVDGVARGTTPLKLAIEPGSHTLTLQRDGEMRTVAVEVAPGAVVSHHIEMPASSSGRAPTPSSAPPAAALPAPAPAAPAPAASTAATSPASMGWVRVASALSMDVLVNGSRVGGSGERISMPAGEHDLTFVNEQLGVRATQRVQVTTGNTASIDFAVPTGTMSMNAQPWAEVWVDGEKIGETPIGNLSLPVGSHDVLFRHPELGERHHTAVVTLAQPTRLSVDLRAK